LGTDMPPRVSPAMNRSAKRPSRTALTRPPSTPASSHSTAAPMATTAVTGSRCTIMSVTICDVWNE
jgi:hypothetical protein